ncbi:MAG: hypothetical protein M3P43_07830, partial [Actinomycetota bacterium]|nr:hypothetical protein [Actinomycetota bacterium]
TRDRAQEFDPTLAPDGRIAYRRQPGDDDTTEIYVMDANGSGERELEKNGVADWAPDRSSDGGPSSGIPRSGSSSGLPPS